MIENIQSDLREHLERGETLLWTGKPKSGIVFTTSDIFRIPISILWCGFAIFWMITASRASTIFALFGVPFVIMGLIFVFGRFFIDAKKRENTTYGITENRIIIKSGIFSKSIKSLNIRMLSDLDLNEKNNNTGTILIGSNNPVMGLGNGMDWWPGTKSSPRLEMIQDARKVYSQIIEIQNIK